MDAPIITVQVEQAPVRQTLRDVRGTLIGTLERQRLTGKVVARDAQGRLIGSFEERSNTTRDASGRLVARGNLLPALLLRGR